MRIRTLALHATMGATLGLTGCAGMGGGESAGLDGTGLGEDPWRPTRAATSPVTLPVTQTGAGIAVIRQGLARAREAQERAAGGGHGLSQAPVEARHIWRPTGEGAGPGPARQADDDGRSGRGPQPQRANG